MSKPAWEFTVTDDDWCIGEYDERSSGTWVLCLGGPVSPGSSCDAQITGRFLVDFATHLALEEHKRLTLENINLVRSIKDARRHHGR